MATLEKFPINQKLKAIKKEKLLQKQNKVELKQELLNTKGNRSYNTTSLYAWTFVGSFHKGCLNVLEMEK